MMKIKNISFLCSIALIALFGVFGAIFISISWGTFQLDPDAQPGSTFGDIAAILFLVAVFAFVAIWTLVYVRNIKREWGRPLNSKVRPPINDSDDPQNSP